MKSIMDRPGPTDRCREGKKNKGERKWTGWKGEIAAERVRRTKEKERGMGGKGRLLQRG